jgi:hypothetical protein
VSSAGPERIYHSNGTDRKGTPKTLSETRERGAGAARRDGGGVRARIARSKYFFLGDNSLRYRVFTYGIPPDEELTDLNNFLASRRILSVRHELVGRDGKPYLLFVVEFLESGMSQKIPERPPKVDYREKLSEQDFEIFSRLRDLRKEIAEREGVPVYSVFTNAQIAEMVVRRVKTLTALQGIPGIGEGKTEKYGGEFLKLRGEYRMIFKKGGVYVANTVS